MAILNYQNGGECYSIVKSSAVYSGTETSTSNTYETQTWGDGHWEDGHAVAILRHKNNYYNYYYDTASGYTSSTRNSLYSTSYFDDEWKPFKNTVRIPTPGERIREAMQLRQAPMFLQRSSAHLSPNRQPLKISNNPAEERARETLRHLVGEVQYRLLLRNGFISVRASSGKVYQIYPGHGITCVFENGKMIERLCVVLSGNFPPTDAMIVRYLMILNDEETFRSKAISHSVFDRRTSVREIDSRPLVEIFRELKKVG